MSGEPFEQEAPAPQAERLAAANIGDASLHSNWNAANWVAEWSDSHPFTVPVGSYKPNA